MRIALAESRLPAKRSSCVSLPETGPFSVDAVYSSLDQRAARRLSADEFTGVSDAMRVMIANSPIGLIYRMVTGFADLIKAADAANQ